MNGQRGTFSKGEAREGFSDEVIFEERPEYNEALSLGDLWGKHSRRDKERRQWYSKQLNVGPKITVLISLGPCSRILICPGCCTMSYTAQNSLPNKE